MIFLFKRGDFCFQFQPIIFRGVTVAILAAFHVKFQGFILLQFLFQHILASYVL